MSKEEALEAMGRYMFTHDRALMPHLEAAEKSGDTAGLIDYIKKYVYYDKYLMTLIKYL